jgi:putative salt-induced outer membrane protein YdiY
VSGPTVLISGANQKAKERNIDMPAKSKSQQKAAGAALSAKRGDTKKSELKGESKSMYESMSESELEDLASTKRKGKAEHKSQS